VITKNGAAATCADVGATTFEIRSQAAQGAGEEYLDRYDCAAMTALTDPLPEGTYIVAVRLLDSSGFVLNTVPVGSTLPLAAGQTVNVGDFEFAF
jgi:hypothetical protein